MTFASLGISPAILRALEDAGYTTPTPIQTQAIPPALAGRDLMAAAQTGTGKTAAFTVPLLQRLADGGRVRANHIRALILTPTRELAMQVGASVALHGQHLSLKSGVVYGGVKINPQMMQLRGGVDVLVATPGRLLDLFAHNAVRFAQVETLVLDEADRMLALGFSDEIHKILALLPKRRQNLLFSATFSEEIRTLSSGLLNNPLRIEVSPPNSTAAMVKQWVIEVDKGKKAALLSHLLRNQEGWRQVLVFTRTKSGAEQLTRELARAGLAVAALYGDKSQAERTQTLAAFKANQLRVLIATDIAARGLDISDLPRVVNFDLPQVAEEYIHRIGRTGRAGAEGAAISLVSADEVKQLAAIEALIRHTLVREVMTGFIPSHTVPLTRQLQVKPKRPKKPKKKPGADRHDLEEQQDVGNKTRRGGRTQEAERQKGVRVGRGRQRQEQCAVTAKKRFPAK